jgi:hypothetical protein
MEPIQYPVGRFAPQPDPLTPDQRVSLIARIAVVPARARAAVDGLSDAHLDTPYREGGWSPRQIVHHLADSHLNAFTRVKLALTEDRPVIKPYDQDRWSEQADVLGVPVVSSLSILDGLHHRWVLLWNAMADDDFGRKALHPEIGEVSVDFLLQMYGWHGDHHVTQVEQLRQRRGW